MNAKIFDIKKYAVHDGPGIRTTIFFSGCPLNCLWCHNPEALFEKNQNSDAISSNSICQGKDQKIIKDYSVDELMTEILKDEIFYDQSGGGVTFSGGEPMLFYHFLKKILTKCKVRGINTAVDTSGFVQIESFEEIYSLVNYFLYDLKIIDSEKHIHFTGVDNSLILENLKILSGLGSKIRIRIPLIPSITDTESNINDLIRFISKLNNIISIDLLPYNKISEDKYKRLKVERLIPKLTAQTDEELFKLKTQFENTGFPVNIRG